MQMQTIYEWLHSDSFKHKKNATVFEIGAHNGSDTVDLNKVFTDSNFYCYEPDPRAYQKNIQNLSNNYDSMLHNNVFLNKEKNNIIHVYDIAISDSAKPVVFKQSGGKFLNQNDWNYSSTIVNPKNHTKHYPSITFNNTITVESLPLDRIYFYYKFNIPIDFVWADVQGSELLMIKGGSNSFFPNTRFLYTEVDNNAMYDGESTLENILLWLKTYEVVFVEGENVLLKNKLL
jgi:FkbM family methyltransferase